MRRRASCEPSMTRSVDQTHRVVEEGRPSSRNAMSQMDDMLYSQLTEVFEGNVGEVTNMLQSLPTFDAHDPSFHRFVEGWPRLFERIKETYAEHRALRASLESVTEQLSEIAGVEPGSVSDQTSESLCKQLFSSPMISSYRGVARNQPVWPRPSFWPI